ncbi:dTDP-4-amino-4,6-dideoxygalactose transaminase [Marinobacter salarius]|uniref:dTDP-4-amino-4,6-dideoxygalactose transaminase n=1 Tax=Marinobacter salarius TaxID=1420917 RepID=UPI003D101223
MIPFNVPPKAGNEKAYVLAAIDCMSLAGDGPYGKLCQEWFEKRLQVRKTLFTPSCTAAIELAAILIDIKPGDEVIMPSYTFVSTANAFVLRGAKIVFVDIRSDTMNIDENLIEKAVTNRTRAIVPVHYAGVSCEMDSIMAIAKRHGLFVIEDAAQGMMSSYKGRALGTIGHFGTYSFHETKNYTSGGEGGLLVINDDCFKIRAEIVREKGTNRSQFFRGMVDKYQWVDVGSSFLPSELQAAYLWGQLEKASAINNNRLEIWHRYYDALLPLQQANKIGLPYVPNDCSHNAHMFYVKTVSLDKRTALIKHLEACGIKAVFHYVPLHTSRAGQYFGRFEGEDCNTTRESDRLVRLPMWYGLPEADQARVIKAVKEFYQ